MKLCERIKQYRKENNLTQQKLANLLFVSRSAVAKWEQERGFPDEDTLKILAKLFQTTEEELLSQKELRNVTIKTAQKVKKQNVQIITGIVLLTILFVLFVVFAIISFFDKPFKEYSITSSQCYFVDICEDKYTFYSFNSDGSRKINSRIFPNPIELDNSILCYDRWGKKVNYSTLRSGYKVKITYTQKYFSQEETKNDSALKGAPIIDKLEIIEDYLEGDYMVNGFFISTEKYEGDVAPIIEKNSNYKPNYNESEYFYYEYYSHGVYYSSSFRYPYVKTTYNGYTVGGISFDSPLPNKILNSANNSVLEENYYTTIKLSKNVSTAYVYVLDNSQKGFTEYSTISVEQLDSNEKTLSITCKNITDSISKDAKYSDSKYTTWNVRIVFFEKVNYMLLQEYNEQHNLIKTTLYKSYEELNATTNVTLQANTSYALLIQNTGPVGIYVKGDIIEVTLSAKYGYLLQKHVKLV